MLRKMALWRLEKGEQLGLPELILGSETVAGTLGTIINLRAFFPASFVLVILWALSPLGGQASLRVLDTDEFTSHPSNTTVNVFTFENNSFQLDGANSVETYQGYINTMYGSSLVASASLKNSLWGNILASKS